MYYTGGPAFSHFQNSTTDSGNERISLLVALRKEGNELNLLYLSVYTVNPLYYTEALNYVLHRRPCLFKFPS
jgi:hypothetical protein